MKYYYGIRSAYDAGVREHPQKEILRLAPDAHNFEPEPLGDCWFFDAAQIDGLPVVCVDQSARHARTDFATAARRAYNTTRKDRTQMQDAKRNAIDNGIRILISWLAVASEYCYRAQSVPVWTSADGRVIPVTEMDEVHLQNAIGVLERRAPHAGRRAWILPALYAERERRRINNAWSQARAGFDPAGARGYNTRAATSGRTSSDRPTDSHEARTSERLGKLERRVTVLEQSRTVSVDMMRRGLDEVHLQNDYVQRLRAIRRAMGL